MIGITGDKEKLSKSKEKVEIILGSKIISINKLFAYDKLETNLLLGNDFIQQFQNYQQTLYMINLKTPCGHYIKIPRIQNPYNLEKNNGNFKRKYLENLRKITCKCLNLERIKENLQKTYG